MKIYAQIKNLGTEYDTYAPIAISTKPFTNYCWIAEFEDNSLPTYFEEVEDIMKVWTPYNVTISQEGEFDSNLNFIPGKLSEKVFWTDYNKTVYLHTKYQEGQIVDKSILKNKIDWIN